MRSVHIRSPKALRKILLIRSDPGWSLLSMASRGTPGQPAAIREALAELDTRRARRAARVPIDVLAEVPLFAGLSRRHLRKLSAGIDELHYRDGRLIVEKGSRGNAFFIVAEGAARVYSGVVPVGRAKARLGQGDFFGEIALLDGGPRSATVVADGNLSVFRLTRSAFVKVVSNEPTIALGIMAGLAGRLRRGAANE
jgi:CRP/FNR family transcriptional regulator, cyclic AMP receptor protein